MSGRIHGLRFVGLVASAALVASVALVAAPAISAASAHRGGWGITRGGAQERLVNSALRPHGDLYGVVIRSVSARCEGDFSSANFLHNNQRYFNHLTCMLRDDQARTWKLYFHATGDSNWQYSSLRRAGGASSGPSAGVGREFQTPSGNIACVAAPGLIECWVYSSGRYAWILSTGGFAKRVLSEDRPGILPVLGYGQTWRGESIHCESSTSGLRCTSSVSGHGFFLSRERQETF